MEKKREKEIMNYWQCHHEWALHTEIITISIHSKAQHTKYICKNKNDNHRLIQEKHVSGMSREKEKERKNEKKVKPSAPDELYFLRSNVAASISVVVAMAGAASGTDDAAADAVVVNVVDEYAFIIVDVSSESFVSFKSGEIFNIV